MTDALKNNKACFKFAYAAIIVSSSVPWFGWMHNARGCCFFGSAVLFSCHRPTQNQRFIVIWSIHSPGSGSLRTELSAVKKSEMTDFRLLFVEEVTGASKSFLCSSYKY